MAMLERQAAVVAGSGRGQADAADGIGLLRAAHARGVATREEAEGLIAFDRSLRDAAPAWTDFFAAAIADHVIRQQAPAGIVDGGKSAWLIGAFGSGRHGLTRGGFAAVLRVIELARDVPPELAAYAIRQVRSAVLAQKEPPSSVRLSFRRSIDAAAAVLVRRILLAGEAARPVSRAEAEALFDLHDLTAGGTNDADFDDLFFKAVVHHLIAAAGQPVPPREEALVAHAAFPRGAAVRLGADEAAWLASQIMRDGRATASEFALLQFFTGEADGAAPATQASAAGA